MVASLRKFRASLQLFQERVTLDGAVVKEVFTHVERVVEEETRQHHLAEVIVFFLTRSCMCNVGNAWPIDSVGVGMHKAFCVRRFGWGTAIILMCRRG